MLKTKCFIVGGMILSSSLQAEVSEPVKKTGDVPEELVPDEEESSALEKLVDKYFPPKPVKETENKPEEPTRTEEVRSALKKLDDKWFPPKTEEDRRIEEMLEKDGRFELMKRLGFDPEKLTRDEADRIIERQLERKGRFDFIKMMGNDPEKIARTKKCIVEEEKQLVALDLIKKMNERWEEEIKIIEAREQEELKRKVKEHETEIQQLKIKLKSLEYDLDVIRRGPILDVPLPSSLRR